MSISTLQPPVPLDLHSPALRDDPYPIFDWYRENDPVHRFEARHEAATVRWLLTRFEDVQTGLKDMRLRRQVHRHALWNRPLEEVPAEFHAYARTVRQWPLFLDPPQHTGPRRALNRVLEAIWSAELKSQVVAAVDHVLSGIESAREFDAVSQFALLVPLELNRRWLGLARHSAKEVRPHAASIIRALGSYFEEDQIRAASAAILTLSEWFAEALADHETAQAPMLRRLIAASDDDQIISREQVIPLAILLLLTALDTTVNLLGNGIHCFLRHPEQLGRLMETPEIAENAAWEVARFESPVQQVTRHATESLEIGGRVIAAGEGVSFLLGAANRDPRIFPEPARFDITRAESKMAAFGFGIHQCPGARLAIAEAAVAWPRLFTRFPGLQLSTEKIEWLPLVTFRGPQRLPVRMR